MENHNDLADDAGPSDDEVNMAALRRQPESVYRGRTRLRALIWIVCSIASSLSGKHLMLHTSFHYPFTLSLIYVVAIWVVYVVHRGFSANNPGMASDLHAPWKNTKVLGDEGVGWNLRPYIALLPAAISYAVAIPLLVQGLLHLSSLPTFLMLFPLVYVVERIVLLPFPIKSSKSSSSQSSKWEALSIIAFMVIMLYNEYRLSVNGLFFCIGSIIAIGLFRGLVTTEVREALIGEDRQGVAVSTDYLMPLMSIVSGIISGLAYFVFEISDSEIDADIQLVALIIFNALSSVGIVLSGTTPFVFSPVTYGKNVSPQFSDTIISPEYRVIVSAIPCLVVYLVTTYTGTVYLSSIQLVSFLMSLIALAGMTYIYSVNAWLWKFLRQTSSLKASKVQETGLVVSLFTIGCHLVVILLLTSVIQGGAFYALSTIERGPRPNLDLSYKPRNKFDIVVSMYDEDPDLVKETVAEIINTNYLHSVKPRVIVYTKDPTASTTHIQDMTGADTVVKLDNRGREGGTYLYHIIHNWDSLSEQTMFIQAHVHNRRELIPRIDKFLQQNTGMLSLGFSGVTCNCNFCTDRHGWQDDEQLLPTLYAQIYGDDTCEDVLLSYKGQFVASARRLRGIPKEIYQGLYDSVVGKPHSNEEPAGDDPSAPVFGYSLERLWSLLLQCSDSQVAVKCPTLLSGWRNGGDVSDCQCLDPLEGIRG